MGTKYAVGIDPHHYNIKAILFDIGNRTKEVKRFSLEPCEDDYKTFFSFTSTFNDVDYCIENAKGLGRSLSDYLLQNNAKVFDIHPGYTADYKKKNPNIEKSDWNDCKYIVQAYLLEPSIKQLKLDLNIDYYEDLDEISYERWELGQVKGDIKKKIGIRLYKYFDFDVNYKKRFINRFWSEALIKELELVFRDALGYKARRIKRLIEDLVLANKRIKELDEDLKEMANDEVKALEKNICGCGLFLASRLVAIIRKGYKLNNVRSLSMWGGGAPVQTSTGGKATHRKNYRGRRHLNHLGHQVMTTAIRHDLKTKAYFAKCLARGDTEDKAKTKCKNVIFREIARHFINKS